MATQRTSVVIGAASGMGKAVAFRLRAASPTDRLLLADRNLEAVGKLAAELGAEATSCDVTSPAEVGALAAKVGSFDAAFITAGLSPTMAPGRAIVDVNLAGTARVAEALLPAVREGGALVCFASTAGHMASASQYLEIHSILDEPLAPDLVDRILAAGVGVDDSATAYVVSKYGVLRYVRKQAAAWGARAARIVSVSPGIISTPMGDQEMAHQPAMKDMVEMTPLPRSAGADEVAAVACFLASPAASFVSGCDLLVDGGFMGSITG